MRRGGGFRVNVRSWGRDLRRPGGEMIRSSGKTPGKKELREKFSGAFASD